jgi:lipopolysaccharide assembly outer membrane protein LptD (OstA)
MKKLHAALLAFAVMAFAVPVSAQVKPELELNIRTLSNSGSGQIEFDQQNGTFIYTNGVMLTYGDAVLTADEMQGNVTTGEILAAGHVRLLRDDLTWTGDSLRYNYKTQQLAAEQFRAGRSPVFAAGENLEAENLDRNPTNKTTSARNALTNAVLTARNAFVTTDDIANPAERIRASSIKSSPEKPSRPAMPYCIWATCRCSIFPTTPTHWTKMRTSSISSPVTAPVTGSSC